MAVARQASAGDDAMQMRIMKQALTPGVQHGEEADLGAQVLGIGGDCAQGLGGGAEEKAVDERLVLIGDGGNGLRQREDDVKVLCVEDLGATILQSLRAGQRLAAGAMSIAAAVEGDAPVATLIACFDVPAERGGPAQFDRRHDAALGGRQRRVMLRAIGFAVAAEDVRHFRPRVGHRRAAQKYCGLAGGGRMGAGRGKSSKGLDVAQTLLVAIRR